VDQALRDKGIDLVLLPDDVDQNRLAQETRDADLILMCYTPISAAIIDNAINLKGIVKYGVGIDAIDIEAAKARNIPVVNVPEYAEETVAEGAFMLMIALAKKLIPLNHAMHSDLAEKTVGLVGTGRIGRSMARMAGVGFRARILGYDPNVCAATMAEIGIEKFDDLEAMLEQCDFLSIHAVLNRETLRLIGERQLSCMKTDAFIINVSRGAIIDEAALLTALKAGRLAGAGLDVYSEEPLSKSDHPLSELIAMDNVILMPHLTFYTVEAMQRLEQETLERCFEILQGEPVLIKSKDPRLLGQEHGVTYT